MAKEKEKSPANDNSGRPSFLSLLDDQTFKELFTVQNRETIKFEYSIEFYNDKVWQLILDFPEGIRRKTFELFAMMLITGSELPSNFTKKITDDIFEVRAKAKEGIGRSLYCTQKGKVIVILFPFIKKTQKTPPRFIDLAIKRFKELTNGRL